MSQAGRFISSATPAPGTVLFLEGNTGGPVGPTLAGIINVVGGVDVTVDGNPVDNTLTINLTGSIANTYVSDSGTATPALGILNVNGAGGIQTTASGNTIIIETNGEIATTYDCDNSTSAVPSGGILNVTGGTSGAIFTGVGNTITESFNFLSMADSTSTTGYVSIGGDKVLSCGPGVSSRNIFVGQDAGNATITGIRNSAVGFTSLASGTIAEDNTSVGNSTLNTLTSGTANTCMGSTSLANATTASGNTCIGFGSAFNLLTGRDNTIIGSSGGTGYTGSESSNIVIGSIGTTGDNNQIRIGTQGGALGEQNACNIAGIYGSTVGGTNAAVFIDNAGNLGTSGGSGGVVTSITGNGGGGPVTGAVTLTGGTSGAIFTDSGGNTITESFNFLALPNTNAGATQGVITLGGTVFMNNFGTNNAFFGNSGNTSLTGSQNVGIGSSALSALTSGSQNMGIGSNALQNVTTGQFNTAIGVQAGGNLIGGSSNSLIGLNAGFNLTSGSNNILIGLDSGFGLVTSANNVAIGFQAGFALTGNSNTIIGTTAAFSLTSGSRNTIIGFFAGTGYTSSESSNVLISNAGTVGESNVIRIGTQGAGSGQQNLCNIAGIYGSTVGGTNSAVFIDSTGNLGTVGGSGGGVTSLTGTGGGGALTGALTLDGGSSGAVYTGSGSTITTTFTKINMPFTNVAGTQGVIQFGGANVLGFYGGVGENNVLLGDGAGAAAMSGSKNTGIGSQALNGITSGADNTALGYNALNALTTGGNNTALGEASLFNLVTGQNNIAIGNGSAATYTTSESSNIVIGSTGTIADANQIRIGSQGSGGGQQNKCNIAGIFGSTVGGTNSAVFIDNAGNLGTVGGSAGGVTSITGNSGGALTGALTLTGGTSGGTFTGSGTTLTMSFTSLSLPDTNAGGTNGVIKVNSSNVLAFYGGTSQANVLVGPFTGLNTMSGGHNTVVGDNALKAATSCNDNVAVGFHACQSLTSGSSNIGLGTNSLGNASATTANQNVSIGHLALSGLLTGASNIAIGFQAGINYTSSESSNILLGHAGVAAESNVIRIGDGATQTSFFTTGVAGVTVTSTAAVLVNTSTGQLGTIISSRRFKENIEDMGSVSRDIYKLRPVKFNFKGDLNESYGLIAEDVEEVAPYLVSYDKEGLPVTVRYHDLPALLLNEIQRLKLKIDELEGKFNARLR